MPRTLKVAAVQMNAAVDLKESRLARADTLVTQAAQAGAQLVLLPELFNTGYVYSDTNHLLAEPLDGQTTRWMREAAAKHGIHLGGSLMVLDGTDIYNAFVLFAPDGRMWRYDKNYPWGWERGYFRERHGVTVAQTDLGDFGMLICWDAAHAQLWHQYAGQVDMMLVASCPPDITNSTFRFPNGDTFTFDDMGPTLASLKDQLRLLFGDMINQQTAWLGVPALCTVGAGRIETHVPNAAISWLGFSAFSMSSRLLGDIPLAGQMTLSCQMVQGSKVVAANGDVLTELTQEQGETFTLAEVTLPDQKPLPRQDQPPSLIDPLVYLNSDIMLPALSIPTYRAGLRRAWGTHMAPMDESTKRWMALLGGLAAGVLLSLFTRRKR